MKKFKHYALSLLPFFLTFSSSSSATEANQPAAQHEAFEVVINEHPLISENSNQEFEFHLENYLGRWYEQARLPTFFQKNCASSFAEYTLNTDSTIKVYNMCYKFDGSTEDITGKAKIYPKDPSGRSLIVSFNFINDIINFFAGVNYYIYYVDEAYQYAIIGSPKKDTMWILTRNEKIDENVLKTLVTKSEQIGFDVSKIIYDTRNSQKQ